MAATISSRTDLDMTYMLASSELANKKYVEIAKKYLDTSSRELVGYLPTDQVYRIGYVEKGNYYEMRVGSLQLSYGVTEDEKLFEEGSQVPTFHSIAHRTVVAVQQQLIRQHEARELCADYTDFENKLEKIFPSVPVLGVITPLFFTGFTRGLDTRIKNLFLALSIYGENGHLNNRVKTQIFPGQGKYMFQQSGEEICLRQLFEQEKGCEQIPEGIESMKRMLTEHPTKIKSEPMAQEFISLLERMWQFIQTIPLA